MKLFSILKLLGQAIGLSVFLVSAALADAYPSQPITIVLPFPAGGPTDAYARLIATKLQASLRQPVIVENRPGATGLIGTSAVAKAKPDGYTLLLATNSTHLISPLLRDKPPYDPIRDFEPVTLLGHYPFCLIVSNGLPVATTRELAALAKSQPGKIYFGTVGEGSGTHLMAELFKQKAAIDIVHVPYKGGAAVSTALSTGEVQMYFDSVGSAKKLVDAGKSRAIAVTGKNRSPLFPNVPTLTESGITGFDPTIWLGLFAPKGTPADALGTLHKELKQLLTSDADLRRTFADNGIEILGLSPAEVTAAMKKEQKEWKELIDRLGVKMQ